MITIEKIEELLSKCKNIDKNDVYIGIDFDFEGFNLYAYLYYDAPERDVLISEYGRLISLTQQQEQYIYNFLLKQ